MTGIGKAKEQSHMNTVEAMWHQQIGRLRNIGGTYCQHFEVSPLASVYSSFRSQNIRTLKYLNFRSLLGALCVHAKNAPLYKLLR
jgi:hypothetical protein